MINNLLENSAVEASSKARYWWQHLIKIFRFPITLNFLFLTRKLAHSSILRKQVSNLCVFCTWRYFGCNHQDDKIWRIFQLLQRNEHQNSAKCFRSFCTFHDQRGTRQGHFCISKQASKISVECCQIIS